MLKDDLEDFAIRIQTAFLAGDMDRLLTFFRFPLVIYSMAGVAVMRSEADFRQVVSSYMTSIDSLAPARNVTELLDHTDKQNARFKLLARNRLYDTSDNVIGGSTLRYFVVRTEGEMAVEMIEYIETPLDLSAIEKIYL